MPYLDRMGLQRAGDPIAPEYETGAWFHYNPRRAHLGRLALVGPGGEEPRHPSLLSDVRTELDLWSATVHAEYTIEGERVSVTSVGDPTDDCFAVRVESPLLARGWGVAWVFDEQCDDLAPFEIPLEVTTSWWPQEPRTRVRGACRRIDKVRRRDPDLRLAHRGRGPHHREHA